jgi:hypothetical protein
MAQHDVVDSSQLRLEQYRALLQVSESISINRHLPDLIRDLSVRLKDAVQFDYISLILHDPLRNVLRVQIMETPIEMPIGAGLKWVSTIVRPAKPLKLSSLSLPPTSIATCDMRAVQDHWRFEHQILLHLAVNEPRPSTWNAVVWQLAA